MARKKQADIVAPASAPAEVGTDDLEVLHPDRSTTIAGRAITMREYGFIEGLKLAPLYKGIVDDISQAVTIERSPPLEEIVALLAAHADHVEQLIAIAADVEVEWVRGLDDRNGMNLMYLWWIVNAPFFLRRVFDRIKANMVKAAVDAGATPTPSSSSTATDQATLGDTPAAK